MTRRALAVAVAGCVLLIGVGLWAQGASKSPVANASEPQCALSGKGTFEVGWNQSYQGATYRCAPIFDDALKAAGAAWVKVQKDGTVDLR
jgi:hypothetical protein